MKTFRQWHQSGFKPLTEFLVPGDTVDKELVDYLRDVYARGCESDNYLQIRCEIGDQYDEGDELCPVFSTFVRDKQQWVFVGYCFANETKNRVGIDKIQCYNRLCSILA